MTKCGGKGVDTMKCWNNIPEEQEDITKIPVGRLTLMGMRHFSEPGRQKVKTEKKNV